jgi:hypothetical protein
MIDAKRMQLNGFAERTQQAYLAGCAPTGESLSQIATFCAFFVQTTRRTLVENDCLPSFQGAPLQST